MTSSPARLAPLRHSCTMCGACCQGAVVHLIDDEEVRRVQTQARQLGMEDPVESGGTLKRLRQVGGRCIMLDDSNLCRLHAVFGADDKPAICAQFPHVRVRTESGLREGIDPSAGGLIAESHMQQRPSPASALVRPVQWPAARARSEAQLLAWIQSQHSSTTALLWLLTGRPAIARQLPEGFDGRWLATLQRSDIVDLIAQPEVGPVHRRAVQPILDGLTRWTLDAPPPWRALSAARDKLVLRSVRGMIFLRLSPKIPMEAAVAVLVIGGALAAHWALPDDDEAFGAAVANWCRMLRAPPFWTSLMPSAAELQWLVTGRRPG